MLGDPSRFSFVAEPETNGVAERFNRTLNEQSVYERLFQNNAVGLAVADFITKYNQQRLVEELGNRSPAQGWRDHNQAIAA